MGRTTRSQRPEREDLPPPAPRASSRKVQKNNPQSQEQTSSAQPLPKSDDDPISPKSSITTRSQTEWAKPAIPSRSTRAAAHSERVDATETEAAHVAYADMRSRPIGQFPSDLEYKSTRVEKPRQLISQCERSRKQAKLDDPLESDEYMDGKPLEDLPSPQDLHISKNSHAEGSALSGISDGRQATRTPLKHVNTGSHQEATEIAGSKEQTHDDKRGDLASISLATPISETHDPLSLPVNASRSVSRSSTPFDATTPADTPRETPMLDTLPTSQSLATVSGAATPVTKSYDYVALFRTLPKPTCAAKDGTDINTISEFVEQTIASAQKDGKDQVAISLLHFWQSIGEDEFKLALLEDGNLSDDRMTTALEHLLYINSSEAKMWFEKFVLENTPQPYGNMPARESSISSAVTVETRHKPRSDMFKSSEVYKGTGGKELNDMFSAGKINTAPLCRTSKPSRVDNAQFKRHREWDSNPSHEEEVRQKRARLEELAEEHSGSGKALSQVSSIRPDPRGTEIEESFMVDVHDDSIDLMSNSCYSEDMDDSDGDDEDWNFSWEPRHRSGSLYVLIQRPVVRTEFRLTLIHRPPPEDNSDECADCSKGGKLICCDSCANSFHRSCLGLPPSLPEQWYCPVCEGRLGFTNMVRHEPPKKTQFLPSQDIRSTFTGVSMEVCPDDANPVEFRNLKSYKPGPHMPRMTNPPKTSKAHGEEVKLEPFAYNSPLLTRLMENGHVILCNRCGRSSDGERPIISCDYCPSRFHLDCLDPPLTIPPNRNKAWMCPCHVVPEDLVLRKVVGGTVRERRPRRPQNCSIVDVEVMPTADDESIFDEDFAEARRLRLHPGDIVLNFISAVKENHRRVAQENQSQLMGRLMRLFRAKVVEIGEKAGMPVSQEELAQFQGLLETESRRVGGFGDDPEADAASTLLQLSASAAVPSGSGSRPVTSGPEASEQSPAPAPATEPEVAPTPPPAPAPASRRRSKRPRGSEDAEEEGASRLSGPAHKRRARTG